MKLLKQRIREARVTHDWSQEDLSSRIGVTPAVVSHYETGNRVPSVQSLTRLAAALCVSADWLLGLESHQRVVQCPRCAGKGVIIAKAPNTPNQGGVR